MRKKQNGATLLVVLVLLVLMLFMGMAMFKSTTLAGLISGNTSAKILSTQISDIALAKAEVKLNQTNLDAENSAGYVASSKTISNGIPGGVPTAEDTDWSAKVDQGAYSYRYLIEKLCDDDGSCQTKQITGSSCGSSECIDQLYRVTVEIKGPKNLHSYVQAFYSK